MKPRLFCSFQKRKFNKLLKFIVAVSGDHCKCSPGATKNVSYATARNTQTEQRRHTKRTLLPTSKVLPADGRTDRHMCYLTVQTPDCTSVLVDRLVPRPQLPAGISASSSNMWNLALHHFQQPAVTNYFMNRPESFLRS
jgi:hypothetical protein